MKNKVFDYGLFIEGIRKLKVVGIIFSVLLALDAILTPLGIIVLDNLDTLFSTDFSTVIAQSTTAEFVHANLTWAYFPAVPIMALVLFGFMNKRNACDFYHALPHTRTCLFVSFYSAIAVWAAFMVIASSAVSVIMCTALSKFIFVPALSFVTYAAECIIASLLVTSVFALGMSVTGTSFSNIVVSLIILFLPRISISVINLSVADTLPFVSADKLVPFLSTDYNLVTSGISGSTVQTLNALLFGGTESAATSSIISMIYTLVLAAAYFALAGVLFNKRKSENAGKSAPSRLLQSIYRITLTMALCVCICALLFYGIKGEYSMDASLIFFCFVLYIIAIVVYFVYELITTKKWKNLLRALPGLAIVVGLNVLVLAGMFAIYSIELNYTPSAAQIKSVSLQPNATNTFAAYDMSDYVNDKLSGIAITDRNAISVVSDSLASCVDTFKQNDKTDYYMFYRNADYGYHNDSKQPEYEYEELTFRITTRSGSKYRTIFVPTGKTDIIYGAISGTVDYDSLWRTLPPADDNTVYINGYSHSFDLADGDVEKVYETMKEELKSVDVAAWQQSMTTGNAVFNLNYSTQTSRGSRNITVPVNAVLFPKTFDKYFECVKKASDSAETQKVLDALSSKDDGYIDITLYVFNEETQSYDINGSYIDFSNDGQSSEIADYMLEHISHDDITATRSFAIIWLYYENKDIYSVEENCAAVFAMDDSTDWSFGNYEDAEELCQGFGNL